MDQSEAHVFLQRLAGRPPHETQISSVFVGEDTVWKLKKAVRLNFLDFTQCDSRHRFLIREFELNRPAAPSLYRDVVPLIRAPSGLAVGGEGEVVDWVLRMARIPDADFMLAQVERGLDPHLLDALGDMVAGDHFRRASVLDQTPPSPVRSVRGNADSAMAAGLDPALVGQWLAASERALDVLTPVLAERAAAGFVRRVHGDLHLGNICLWEGKPTPFDALEFDEAMATVDVAYDLAFLLMDLDRRAGRAAANRVMNRYVALTGDAALVRLLPPFLSRRAMVRAHVTREPAYLAAALAYLRPAPGHVVAIGGLPGTGKSTVARALAPLLGAAPGALVVRSDEVRKRLLGFAPEERLPRLGYSDAANASTNAALLDAVRTAAGHGVIADATFLSVELREAVARTGHAFTGIWLEAPIAELERRIAARTGDASDATADVLHRMAASPTGSIGWHRVPSDEHAIARCADLLGVRRQT